jgi:D-alanine-D-alanine ligase-like ATP-grasp enzyme/acylphosphatase
MMSSDKKWLTHLQHAIPKTVYGFPVSMYSIALESWRRGLTVSFINKQQSKAQTEFIISNKQKRFRFAGSRSNVISKETINLCANKHQSKELLKEHGVPVVDGEAFDAQIDDEEIVRYVKEFGYPVVVKPCNGNSGEGVVVNIQDEQALRDALKYVRQQLRHSTILIESYLSSYDYQVYVVGKRVVAAFERVPAYVTGDGERTIQSLIEQKNGVRRRNPGLSQHLIKQNDLITKKMLEGQGYTLESVPEKEGQVNLRIKSNISVGGETVDITDQLPSHMKEMAIKARETIPDLPLCAVEIIVDKETKKGYVLEIKTQPSISGHLFPVKGKARDVARNIIDYYFPETKSKIRDTRHYFDFDEVYKMFQTNYLLEYTLPRVPQKEIVTKRFVMKGIVHRKDLIDTIQPKICLWGLNGFFRYRRNGRLVLVVAGTEDVLEQLQPLIESMNDLKKEDFSIEERKWDKPVKVGFEIVTMKDDMKKRKKKIKRNGREDNSRNFLGKIIESVKDLNVNL